MSQPTCRLLIPVSVLVLAYSAYALCADPPKVEQVEGTAFRGEVVVIESKSGLLVEVEKARMRSIAGQDFVGGTVLAEDSLGNPIDFAGGVMWIPLVEVKRIVEFDTKAKLADSRKKSAQINQARHFQIQGVDGRHVCVPDKVAVAEFLEWFGQRHRRQKTSD